MSSTASYYTGMTFDQWVEAKEHGLSPGELGIVLSREIGYIDGYIEGYLTGIYGETYFAKVEVDPPQGADIVPEEASWYPPENKFLGFLCKDWIPPDRMKLVEAWKAGPLLAEEVERLYREGTG